MTADLSIIPGGEDAVDAAPQYEDRSNNRIPTFEGKDVALTKAKITSVGLDIEDEVYRVDDYVRMYIEGRVSAVHHVVNEKTGGLERVHVIKAIDGKIIDWNDPAGAI